jgi:hypothetical protein
MAKVDVQCFLKKVKLKLLFEYDGVQYEGGGGAYSRTTGGAYRRTN